MSGWRFWFRSPKFAEAMTSEAIEVSGVKVCIFAIGRGSGMARRFESLDANEPGGISILKPGETTAIEFFKNNVLHYSLPMSAAQSPAGVSGVHFGRVCAERITPPLRVATARR